MKKTVHAKDSPTPEEKRESGLPGGGAGRTDEVGGSGVYPLSGPHPRGDAPIVPLPAWGQGERGAQGYEDAGESELMIESVTPEKCRELMTKDPICCVPNDTVALAGKIMRDLQIGAVPIVADAGTKKLVGIITDRDLALRVVAEGRDPKATPVEEAMTGPVVSCSPDDDIQHALDAMETHQIRRIPAVDNTGRIVGIISQADVVLRLRQPVKTVELLEEISKPRFE